MQLDTVAQADAFDYLAALPDRSVHAVITDPPYLTTALGFDQQTIDWARLISECLRVTIEGGAVVMFAAMRTAVAMIAAAPKYYRYEWIWVKSMPTGHPNAPLQPMRKHEYVLVWSTGEVVNGITQNRLKIRYYPVLSRGNTKLPTSQQNLPSKHYNGGVNKKTTRGIAPDQRYPTSVLEFAAGNYNSLHPTQKPLDLMTYLVRTYTQAGEVVLDPFLGSGTTAVAARNLNRRYLGCDLSAEYLDICKKRLAEPFTPPMFADDADDPAPDGEQLTLWD
jgi:site-specific DNA-methyltransferase (adenine-specific)